MKYFRKVWSPERNQWLLDHKDMIKNEMYKLFLETFPECNDVTYIAFKNQCSRVGASYTVNNCWRGDRKPRPLYSEQQKKGYIRIKIAQPNVWISKSKWVYLETHPWEYEEIMNERSNYIFLDGNNRNFSPENIERVPLKIMGVFNSFGGCEKGQPEITKLNLLRAKHKVALLDAGDKLGLTVSFGVGRRFRDEINQHAREYRNRSDVKIRKAAQRRERMHKMKIEEPERYRAILDANNKRRLEKKNRLVHGEQN